jgi:hypothetical protein
MDDPPVRSRSSDYDGAKRSGRDCEQVRRGFTMMVFPRGQGNGTRLESHRKGCTGVEESLWGWWRPWIISVHPDGIGPGINRILGAHFDNNSRV